MSIICIFKDVRVGTAQSLLNRPTVRENVRDGCQSRADCMLSICPPFVSNVNKVILNTNELNYMISIIPFKRIIVFKYPFSKIVFKFKKLNKFIIRCLFNV